MPTLRLGREQADWGRSGPAPDASPIVRQDESVLTHSEPLIDDPQEELEPLAGESLPGTTSV